MTLSLILFAFIHYKRSTKQSKDMEDKNGYHKSSGTQSLLIPLLQNFLDSSAPTVLSTDAHISKTRYLNVIFHKFFPVSLTTNYLCCNFTLRNILFTSTIPKVANQAINL